MQDHADLPSIRSLLTQEFFNANDDQQLSTSPCVNYTLTEVLAQVRLYQALYELSNGHKFSDLLRELKNNKEQHPAKDVMACSASEDIQALVIRSLVAPMKTTEF